MPSRMSLRVAPLVDNSANKLEARDFFSSLGRFKPKLSWISFKFSIYSKNQRNLLSFIKNLGNFNNNAHA